MKLNDFFDLFQRPKRNIPELDGLRAIAILLVIGLHVSGEYLQMGGQAVWLNNIPPFKAGWIGVPLFYVLSGYLIGGQLWREYDRTGDIHFLRFFWRRGLRIWPLYYFCMIFIALFALNGEVFWKGIISNSLFLSNYWKDVGPINGAWSLATEEQFYILAPLFIILITKLKGQKSLSYYRKILWVALFFPTLFRIITWYFISPPDGFDLAVFMKYIYRPIHTNCEGLIIGMIISNYLNIKKYESHAPYRILLIALSILALSFLSKVYFNILGIAIGFGLILWLCLTSHSLLNKFLSLKVFYPIAKTSFGIYLIHVPIIKFLYEFKPFGLLQMSGEISLILTYILSLLLSIVICSFLYVGVEKPFLKYRQNFLKRFE